MTDHEQQIEVLTDKLSALENESRRILSALQWATKVRLILFLGLLLFVAISTFLFYQLYNDIKTRRIAEIQKIISERPAEFSEPLTRQLIGLAEEQGPFVADVFRKQAQQDSKLYLTAFDAERNTLIANLQQSVEAKLAKSYTKLLDDQEALLIKEFPQLEDPEKMKNVRRNMELVHQKIGNRYYSNFLKEELDELANQLDTFPPTDPKQYGVPVAEQVASEFLELVRMMLVQSEHYVEPSAKDSAEPVLDARPSLQKASKAEVAEDAKEAEELDGDQPIDAEESEGEDETDKDEEI